jgi:hypothetical protein
MANASFGKSIGDSTSLNCESVGLSQSVGGPVSGYPQTKGAGTGKVPSKGGVDNVAPAAGTKPVARKRDDDDIPRPSKTAHGGSK